MRRYAKLFALASLVLYFLYAHAAPVHCTATCVMGSKEDLVTVSGKGVDQPDAIDELRKSCDKEAKVAKATTHYLATSFNKPNGDYTKTQTEFDVKKACF